MSLFFVPKTRSLGVPRSLGVLLTEIFLSLGLCLTAPLCAAPKSESFRGAPPLPAEASLSIDRKLPVRIPLRVLGPQSEFVKFLLRTPPKHGSVSLLSNETGSEAWVEYRPPADRSITSDHFGFAASNSKGVSSEAFISLQITDRLGRFELPKRIDFPPTHVGLVSQQKIPLKNLGDAVLSGTITAPAGWSCKPEQYRLEPQQELLLEITLKPSTAGSLSGNLLFSHQPDQPVRLSASVEDWIQAQPDPLKLFAVSNSQTREALLRLSNPHPQPHTVLLVSNPTLDHPAEVELRPGETKEIPVRSTQLPKEPTSGVLKLIQKGDSSATSRLLLWNAEATAPQLRIPTNLAEPVVIPPESPLFTPIALENDGGAEGVWTLQASPPFAVDSTVLRLLPGKTIQLQVFTAVTPAEKTEGKLKIQGHGQTFELRLVATPAPNPNRPASAHRSSPKTLAPPPPTTPTPPTEPPPPGVPSTSPQRPKINEAHARIAARAFLPGLAVANSRLSRITHHSAQLEMPCNPDFPSDQLRVESRIFLPSPNSDFRVEWVRMTEAKIIRSAPDRIRILFQDLAPNTPYTIRVLGPAVADGHRVALHQCDITTAPQPPWITPGRLFLALLLLSAGLLWKRHSS